jgi:hypothetical protein
MNRSICNREEVDALSLGISNTSNPRTKVCADSHLEGPDPVFESDRTYMPSTAKMDACPGGQRHRCDYPGSEACTNK